MDDEHTNGRPAPDLDAERLRSTLRRAVRRACPRWMEPEREDLVQEAVTRLVALRSRREEFAPPGPSYLWRVAHSVVMDEVRRRLRRPEVALEEAAGPEGPPAPAAGPAQEDRMDLRAAIDEGLGRLAPARRQAVVLFLHGFGLEESARALGWPVKRVDNLRYRGLADLRRALRRRGIEP